MFKLEYCFLPSSVGTIFGKLETDGELLQEEVQKFPATTLSFYEAVPSYLNKWTKKAFRTWNPTAR
jgi:hypothetical protein